MIHYACIFNQSPVGLTNSLIDNPPSGFQTPSIALATYLQNITWEIVTTYPRTGITDNPVNNSEINKISHDVSIYPNPTTDNIYISNKDANMHSEKIILNSVGNEVYRGAENQINLSHLSSGIYILRIGNKNIKIVKH